MKLIRAKIKGFNGIAGTSEIEIDFTKCKHNIIVIAGENGIGKSRLLNALTSILPVSSEYLIPTMEASQEFQIIDDINMYELKIVYPLTSTNKRGTTKGSIRKNGVELNENGNITSYKEILFNEFELDGNYLGLSRLSGDDRGIVDKKPGERRKFVSSMLDSLEVYNGMYKTLTKKANIFKSHVNNCSNKIQNIGDETYLRTTLVSTDTRIQLLEQNIDECKQKLADCNAKLSVNNITEETKREHEEIYNERAKAEKEMIIATCDCCAKYDQLNKDPDQSLEDIELELDKINETIKFHENTILQADMEVKKYLEEISSLTEDIDKLTLKIEEKSKDIDPELNRVLDETVSSMDQEIKELELLDIKDPDSITANEIQYISAFLDKFISEIDRFYESSDSESLTYLSNDDFQFDPKEIETAKETLNNCINRRTNCEKTLIELSKEREILNSIGLKPENCRNKKCYFIKSATDLLDGKYNGNMSNFTGTFCIAEHDRSMINEEVNHAENTLNMVERAYQSFLILDNIFRDIKTNSQLLKKLKLSSSLLSIEDLKRRIAKEDNFNEFRNIDPVLYICNTLTSYKSHHEVVDKLKSKKLLQQNIEDIIGELTIEKEEKQKRLVNIEESRSIKEEKVRSTNNIVVDLKKQKDSIEDLMNLIRKSDKTKEYLELCDIKYQAIHQQFEQCDGLITEMEDLKQMLENMRAELEPLKEQRRGMEGKLTILDDYQKEYAMYREKYDIVERLQRYSSPRYGIQEMFMNVYMSKTLDLSNQILGMLFEGRYRLLNYVIQDGEFRMPFLSNGMVIDDVSSGSRSQICMMGMIINLVMRNQASTKFNITALDEIDSGLDYNNRYMFVDVLYKLISILNIEQLFIISHSIELETNNVDVIQLSDKPDYNDVFANANVIWKRNL